MFGNAIRAKSLARNGTVSMFRTRATAAGVTAAVAAIALTMLGTAAPPPAHTKGSSLVEAPTSLLINCSDGNISWTSPARVNGTTWPKICTDHASDQRGFRIYAQDATQVTSAHQKLVGSYGDQTSSTTLAALDIQRKLPELPLTRLSIGRGVGTQQLTSSTRVLTRLRSTPVATARTVNTWVSSGLSRFTTTT